MEQYDPLVAPDPQEWLSEDEGERIVMIEQYHRKARIKVPNQRVHAAIHAVVENQIAMGDETPARETLSRLMADGLDRHEAVHAIGCVVSESMFGMLKNKAPGDPNEYYDKLRSLTADEWRSLGEQ